MIFSVQLNRGGVEMNRRDFLSGRWGPYLERALVIKPTYAGSLDGGKVGDSNSFCKNMLLNAWPYHIKIASGIQRTMRTA